MFSLPKRRILSWTSHWKPNRKNDAAEPRRRPPKPSSQRHKNVRKEFKIWLDAIVRIYYDTDPAKGEQF